MVTAGQAVDASVLALVNRLRSPPAVASLSEVLEHKIATAISIGLLQSGDRLPSEEAMAQILGVSGLTLRQALSRLRMRNLVSTRQGRKGGTVVSSRPEALEELARNMLSATPTSELADLGTGFSALLSRVVRLAALRHDQFDDERLRERFQYLVQAGDAIQRRRAATLFVVTVGAVGRSETLMEFVIPVVGDLQSVLWLDDRETVTNEFLSDARRVLQAITDSEPDLADRLARELGDRLTSHLVAQRAGQYTGGKRCAGSGFVGVIRRLDGIRAELERAAKELEHLSPPRPVRSGSAEAIDELLRVVVGNNGDVVRGAGIAYAPGLLPDAPLWMDWWDANDTKPLTFKSHTFSSTSLWYYDYTRMPWFTEPLRRGAFGAQGPYLDRGGIERVTITVSLPVAAPAFAGSVLGADLRLGAVGELFFAGDDPHPGSVENILVDRECRVIAGAVPGWGPGDVLPSARLTEVAGIDPKTWPGLGDLGWRLVHVC